MASPNHTQPSTHPITPPAEPSTATTNANTTSQPTAPNSNPNPNPNTTTTTTANTNTTLPAAAPTQIPSTSLKDSGKTRRPRDVRLIHMLLSSLGVTAYQERIPLQLLDFAYRYTSSVLQDAVHLATEGYAGSTDGGPSSSRAPAEINSVSLPALRLSIASRLHYQFQPGLPKEFLMDVAAERNRVALPGASRGFDTQGAAKAPAANQSVVMGGMRLPPERFCLTGTGWGLKDEWESEGEEEEVVEGEGAGIGNGDGQGENGVLGKKEEGDGEEEEEDEDGKMEDVFGEDTTMGEGDRGGDGDGDRDMEDV
ncbi:TFIID-31kDa-domain-containing protein [Aspergillus heteromorphus CBS 117.55]|uniref:TFIID-31kDa-domain-containing protein n=1 Tax=Aspergillus heteromorphus CBS 117.55 TaxID=1448321 RepID=A0A317X047_9EURO|nr:TFIID-31kDa-domain-containing protein [Aspergillus heteromorphus CBS 117.55]PWY92009.1 TFIID-31kDa-domain-containing protein [Aspergillus heteromorphus CBS 117.55]